MSIPLEDAIFCTNCNTIFKRENKQNSCPVCNKFNTWPVSKWIPVIDSEIDICPVMYVAPNEKTAKEINNNKIMPLQKYFINKSTGLTNKQIIILTKVFKGADIFSIETAKILVDLKKLKLVEIVTAKVEINNKEEKAYFGAITTPEGDKIINDFFLVG